MSDNENRRMSKYDRADPKVLFMSQVTRCLQTAGTQFFSANVEALLRLLPTASFMQLLDQEDKWVYEKTVLMFKSNCGHKIGKANDPLVWNDDRSDWGLSSNSIKKLSVERFEGEIDWDDPNIVGSVNVGFDGAVINEPVLDDDSIPVKRLEGEIDWSDPRIVSPYKIIEEVHDHDELFRMILTEAQSCGIWWQDVAGGVVNLPGGIAEVLKATKSKPRTPQ